MKKTLILTTAILGLTLPVMAQEAGSLEQTKLQKEQIIKDPVAEKIEFLQKEWARIKYQVADKNRQVLLLKNLENKAAKISALYPNRAEPKIWEAIILSTEAGIKGGLGALGNVKKAKLLLEAAIKQDPHALDGSAYTSLGSLYYQVPGWPVGFGNNDKAEKYLKKALEINPNGIDPNFFYADFLIRQERYDEAKEYLNRALKAPDRPLRLLADVGRRQEVRAAIARINVKKNSSYNNSKKENYN